MGKRFVNHIVLTITLFVLVVLGIMACFLFKGSRAEDTENSTIRIMSYNLLVDNDDYSWGTSLVGRPNGAVKYILNTRPDVIGIQEASLGWYNAFRIKLVGEYDFVEPDFGDIEDGSCTGLMYDVKKLKLIASEQII